MSNTHPAPTSNPDGKRSIPFLMVIGLFGMGLGFTINILDPFIYTEKVRLLAPAGLKNTVLGFLTIMALLVAFVVQPVAGWLSDRTRSPWGKRAPYLTAGVAGVSMSLILIVLADNLWLLLAVAMLLSAFSNTTQSAWQALIPDRVPEFQRGTAAGIKTVMELVGVITGITVVGITMARGNLWAAPLAAIALFLTILGITLFTLRQTGNPETHPQPDGPAVSGAVFAWRGLARQLRNQMPPVFLWWMLNRALFWAAGISIRTFILNYMEDVLAISPAEAQAVSSRFFVMLGAGVLLLAVPTGALADRAGRRPLLVVAGLLAAAGAVLFIFLRDLNLLFAAGALIAAGGGIFASASWALATDLAPPNRGAQSLALANAATILGSISGRLGGPLIDGVNRFSGSQSTGYLVVFAIAALFFAGSSAAVLKMDKPQ